MSNMDYRYFNFPIVLLDGFINTPLKVLNNIYDYATYVHCIEYFEKGNCVKEFYENGQLKRDGYKTYYKNGQLKKDTDYFKTDFDMYAIVDKGWGGSVTEEIFSYQGIAAVINGDIEYFKAWHRTTYYLMYMYNHLINLPLSLTYYQLLYMLVV